MKLKNPPSLSGAAAKKPHRWRRVILIAVLALTALAVLALFVLPRLLFQGAMENFTAGAQSAEVTTGTVTNSIVGTGSLTSSSTESVELPSGLVIDTVYVSAGDQVQAGDTLASVDASSIQLVLQSLQETLDGLDEELEEALEEDEDETELETSLSGRIIKIYAAEGDDAASIVAEYGALMLLSADGRMSVTLEDAGSLAVGDEVTVTLSDGTEKEGTVESVSAGAVITIGDKGTELDESVTVTDAGGNSLGRGTLTIHQPIAITAVSGVVSELEVEENDAVDAGDTLCTLEHSGSSAEVQELTRERQEVYEQLQQVLAIAQTGTVTAPSDGVVQSVNISSSGSSETASASSAVSFTALDASSADTGGAVTLLGAVVSGEAESGAAEEDGSVDGEDGTQAPSGETGSDSDAGSVEDSGETGSGSGETGGTEDGTDSGETAADTPISDFSALTVTAPVTGAAMQTGLAGTEQYTGEIVWQTADTVFAAGTTYRARITLTAQEGYCFSARYTPLVNDGVDCLVSGLSWSEDGKTLSFLVTFSATEEEQSGTQGDTLLPDQDSTGENNGTGSGGSVTWPSGGSGSGFSGGSGSVSVSSGSIVTAASTTVTATESSTDSSAAETVSAFTLSASESMCISISVDELDINTVSVGQSAVISLDAIEDESFEGAVTAVSSIGSSAGGSTQYTVEISFAATAEMKLGMSATATITTEEAADVLTLPVSALQQSGSSVFVYTSMDEEGNLGGEVEVETGLSDGETVEIVSGLEEGQTVYYLRSASSSESESAAGGFSFGGGQMPDFGGSSMPDMSEMPSMGGGGGQMPGMMGG